MICSISREIKSVAARPASSTSTCVMLVVKARRVWLNIATSPRMMTDSSATTTRISTSENPRLHASDGELLREMLMVV